MITGYIYIDPRLRSLTVNATLAVGTSTGTSGKRLRGTSLDLDLIGRLGGLVKAETGDESEFCMRLSMSAIGYLFLRTLTLHFHQEKLSIFTSNETLGVKNVCVPGKYSSSNLQDPQYQPHN